MLRTLAFVTVWQQHHQSAHAQPLCFAGGDELVDDDLSAVGKVAELGFPKHQHLRFSQAVTVLEAQDAGF